MQQLIALCLRLGISKRELFEDYYMDELGDILEQFLALGGEKVETVGVDEFFA